MTDIAFSLYAEHRALDAQAAATDGAAALTLEERAMDLAWQFNETLPDTPAGAAAKIRTAIRGREVLEFLRPAVCRELSRLAVRFRRDAFTAADVARLRILADWTAHLCETYSEHAETSGADFAAEQLAHALAGVRPRVVGA